MGMFSKFWNTNARPEGWLGRFSLRMMSLTHTPMAWWNLSFIDFQPDWTILDVGCGGGKNIARMLKHCPQGQVYGIDYSEESVAMSRKKNNSLLGSRCFIEQGNVMELPYETGKFDLVTAFETVYFWPDLKKSFSEVYRVLKPGGMFMFSYGLESNASMRYWADQIDAMNILPIDEISKILSDTGFENLQTATKGDYTINFRIQKPEARSEKLISVQKRTMKYTLTDRLMWHFMQGTCYKVLRTEYPEWDFHQLRKAAKERFRDILTSTPSIGSYRENSLKKNLVGGMVWFAIYETAKERYGSQMSLPLYEKMCRASISMPMMLRMARMAKPFTRKFQESMMKRSERENRIDSPYNWQAHYQLGKVEEEFTLSYTRCGLCELARKRGHLDILPAMCKTDYITFKAMGAILHRNKTLASGDECCHYYMTKPGSEAEQRWQDEHPDGTFISK